MVKFGTRDLFWLIVVAALVVVLFTNMFAFRRAKREMREKYQTQLLLLEEEVASLKVRATP